MADAKAHASVGTAAPEPDPAPIPFIDLAAQRRRLGPAIEQAVARVLDHGRFILGPEVEELEARLAAFAGQNHAITCSSGTDALSLALMAWEIGPGDAVFVPSFTFAATAEAAVLLGATPVFCDVTEDAFNRDPESFESATQEARRLGLRPRAVIPVDLFGQPAAYHRIEAIARANELKVLADAATLEMIRSLRVHGAGRDKYDNVRVGLNARLDTMQAAILLAKLEIFEDEIAARRRVAACYPEALKDLVEVPGPIEDASPVWAQYTIRLEARDAVAARLGVEGIPMVIYCALPLHRQHAYRDQPSAPGGTPVAERLAERVLSLPMHPYLDEATEDCIVGALRRALAG